MNFLMNSGSFYIFAGGMVLSGILYKLLNFVLRKFPANERVRKIGISARSKRIHVPMALNKLVLEMYIDMGISSFLMLYAYLKVEKG